MALATSIGLAVAAARNTGKEEETADRNDMMMVDAERRTLTAEAAKVPISDLLRVRKSVLLRQKLKFVVTSTSAQWRPARHKGKTAVRPPGGQEANKKPIFEFLTLSGVWSFNLVLLNIPPVTVMVIQIGKKKNQRPICRLQCTSIKKCSGYIFKGNLQ
jgi:hypothetical protein